MVVHVLCLPSLLHRGSALSSSILMIPVAPAPTPRHISLVCVRVLSRFSCVQLFETPWIVACQAPLSMEFSRQEYWSGLTFPSPGDLPNLGIKPGSLTSLVLASRFFTASTTWENPCFSKGDGFCFGCCKKNHRLGSLNSNQLFLRVLKAGSPRSRCQQIAYHRQKGKAPLFILSRSPVPS